jgi:hypothetical protein
MNTVVFDLIKKINAGSPTLKAYVRDGTIIFIKRTYNPESGLLNPESTVYHSDEQSLQEMIGESLANIDQIQTFIARLGTTNA